MKIFQVFTWAWWVEKSSRTWVAHGLVSVAVSSAGEGLARALYLRNPLLIFALLASAMMVFYSVREKSDEDKYKGDDAWNEDQNREGVTNAVDQAGDLVGPLFVMLTGWAAFILASLE